MTTADLASLARHSEALARAWLDGLEPGLRDHAVMPFESADRLAWDYRPGDRLGLAIRDMSESQRAAAMDLVETALSQRGVGEVRAVISRESVLGELERRDGRSNWARRDPERYWFAVFGTPDASRPWGWRIDGHHVSVHVTVVGDKVAVTPLFLGANPAQAPAGVGNGARLLGAEETLARALLGSLSTSQKAAAIVEPVAPDDILTSNLRTVDPGTVPIGIGFSSLEPAQQAAFERLVRHYLERATSGPAQAAWARLETSGLDRLSFAWAGPEAPGHGHYYVVRGERLILEYDNTQNGANHVHSVWRDTEGDWGADVLAAHYAAIDHS